MIEYHKYLRSHLIPHIWCTGCGNGIVLKAMIRAFHKLGLENDELVMVSGIGCSSRITGYVDVNTLHTTHGRALTFATGLKLARPQLTVVVVSGDGDGTAIGGNHFIHAARRNLDMTLVIFNNYIYGMTGGQASPTTPLERFASTAPHGKIDTPFDISALAQGAGASFVARETAYHVKRLEKILIRAISKKGFSVVEVHTPCPTAYGRRNKAGPAKAMMRDLKNRAVRMEDTKGMSGEELRERIVTGILVDEDKPEYLELHHRLIERLKTKN